MATYDGKDFLVKISDGQSPASYTTIGGFQSNDFTINHETVDVTNKNTSGKWRELAPFGIRSMTVSGNGVFTDSATENTLLTQALTDGVLTEFQIVVPGMGTFEGAFIITSLQFTGPNNEAVTDSVTLESADKIEFEVS